jgi:hypothetical protein
VDNEIEIESGIAIPAQRAVLVKYPFAALKKGDSFLFKKDTKRATAYSTASYNGRILRRKFIVRQTEKGLRCWRIA